ncbi:hypothetical protein ANAEL_05328 [Anaerolineales bacterium]|nr:hypothetical protein ANAEL_05328 [Anaerolineales bacterium]
MFNILHKEKGQGLVEYALIAALVSLALIGSLMAFGPQIKVVVTDLTDAASGGLRVEDGDLFIPGLSPSSTPSGSRTPTTLPTRTVSPTPTATRTPTSSPTPFLSPTPTLSPTPIPLWTATPTWTPIMIVTATPNTLACTLGSATVSSQNACAALSASNNCENYTYRRWNGRCSWY